MSMNRRSLSPRSLFEQVFYSVGLVALCSSISVQVAIGFLSTANLLLTSLNVGLSPFSLKLAPR